MAKSELLKASLVSTGDFSLAGEVASESGKENINPGAQRPESENLSCHLLTYVSSRHPFHKPAASEGAREVRCELCPCQPTISAWRT